MTLRTSSKVVPEVFTARRTESFDIPGISKLIKYTTEKTFGRINVIYLLEKSNLAVTLSNEKNEVIAHAALLDYPNWNMADQAKWELWLFNNYEDCQNCTPLNTLFLHLYVAKDNYSVDYIQEIVRASFNAVLELHFIFLLTPKKVTLGSVLGAVFKPMRNLPSSPFQNAYSLYVCHAYEHCPHLHIRRAKVEDHDDLMPIFMHHNDILKATYGEYFLAELIEAQDEDNHAVVCEVMGTAVGFMSVCSEVNVQLLHDCFDLRLFHGLCKPDPDDILKPEEDSSPKKELSRQASHSSESTLFQHSEINDMLGTEIWTDMKTEELSPQALESVTSLSRKSSTRSTVSEKEVTTEISSAEQLEDDVITGVDFKSSRISITEKDEDVFRPIYKGAVSAFCIQLYCIDEKYETRALDFLNFVFSLFPDKDYCIISVPKLVPEFVLLQHFVRVIPYDTCTLPHELYIFHRAGLLKSLTVRAAVSSDSLAIEILIQNLNLHESILDDLKTYNEARRDFDGTPVQAFVANVLDQIVGVAIIRNEEDIEYIRSHYNIEDFIYFSHHQREEHGHLHHFAVNPIFQHYSKHFLKEILRLSYKSCLYYPIYPPYMKDKNPCAHSLTSALHYMVPVRPRQQIVYPLEKLGINAPSKQVSKDQVNYALNHINRKLTLEPKVTINARIVVVGASDVGISFLETLVFCPHLKFNNIILISTHGLPGKRLLPSNSDRRFLASSYCFNDKDYALMSLRSWVNVVVGKMTCIDRAAKHVVVSGNTKVPYDHLILCTGQQYQIPFCTGADISKLLTNREIEDCSNKRYTGKVPENLFTLNDDDDCLKALIWLKHNFVNKEGNAIVFGNTLDVYTTVEMLLSLGINGSRIFLIQPPMTCNITCFNNYKVERAVQESLSEAGVTLYYNSKLAQWNDGGNPDPIQCSSFTTDTKPFKLQCAVFFNFYQKGVDYEAFKAINDACLVYNGRLVIDTTFHTNDVTIRAAGPLTKYSSQYYANEWTHNNFNSKEIGFQLAAAMLPLFDPTLEPISEPLENLDKLIPMYKAAKIQGGVLPGGYNYLHVAKPAIPTPLHAQMSRPDYGQEIVTEDKTDWNYFRLHINQYNMVETITCLSQQPLPVSNYIRLYRQHERLLNNLCDRFEEGLISDFYSYFREPWSLAIYHDRFIDFKQEVRQILASSQLADQPSVEALTRQVVDREVSFAEHPKTYLKRYFEENGYGKPVERSVLNYLNYNSYHLPMFARPGMI
ncbi:cilia- and flagella-associated protein 61 [Microcaecilia unicolor]|uniref:Cilia- and flagella-associated protein 61 n=1 Tax=Microcaecilia unicolor TaxID=1415580 RepID=A0A6P7X911_9AMPH|nr:cilia- and flagella-associated protein 61 [Microcaecilia unicolor]